MSERKLGFHFQPHVEPATNIRATVEFNGNENDHATMGFTIPGVSDAPVAKVRMLVDADDLEEFGSLCVEFAGRMRKAAEQSELAEEAEE